MKKINFLLATLLAVFTALPGLAEKVSFTVNVANPASVKCSVAGTSRTLTQGANVFEVDEYTYISFEPVSPYYITRVTNAAGTAQGANNGSWQLYASSYINGETYTIVTTNLDEFRTATCTVNVDDPSLITAQLSGYNTTLTLSQGTNTIKFDPDFERSICIGARNYDVPIYSVKLNGTNVAAEYGNYNVPIADGDVIDIVAKIPEKDIVVTFSYSEQGQGAIKSVSVAGTPVADFNGTSVAMKSGQKLGLTADPGYKIESVTIDGKDINWTGGYEYTQVMLDNAAVSVNAHPYGKIKASVVIDDPTNIILYNGYSYQNQVIALQPGINEIELSENNNVISWAAADGCYITSVKVGDETLSSYTTSYNVTEGMTIEFVTGKIVLDKTAVVWVDDHSAPDYYMGFQSNDRQNITLADGYNLLPFYDGMNPFMLSWAASKTLVGKVYLNDELIEPQYEGSTSYQFTLPDEGVLKIFFTTEPESCAVSFDVADGAEATVTRDIVQNVADWKGGFNCFKGTQLSIAGNEIGVSVNGTPVNADEQGNYVFTVSDPATAVSIAKTNVGVDSISMENADDDVWSVTGVRVGKRSAIGTLAPGIYISGGKKIVVK